MDELNDFELQRHIRALKQKGCVVLHDGDGQFIVQMPSDHQRHLGETLLERNTPHEWMTVMEAVEELGITYDDLDK